MTTNNKPNHVHCKNSSLSLCFDSLYIFMTVLNQDVYRHGYDTICSTELIITLVIKIHAVNSLISCFKCHFTILLISPTIWKRKQEFKVTFFRKQMLGELVFLWETLGFMIPKHTPSRIAQEFTITNEHQNNHEWSSHWWLLTTSEKRICYRLISFAPYTVEEKIKHREHPLPNKDYPFNSLWSRFRSWSKNAFIYFLLLAVKSFVMLS